MRRKILIAINYIAVLSFIVASAALDSDSWIPCIVCAVSVIWLALMMIANRDLL